jgi:DNA repair exonuclease SbcCD ATPase subunit
MKALKELRLLNWKPFIGENCIEFHQEPLMINGPNWSGKSSILEALAWVITGSHIEWYDSDLIHSGEDQTEISITFDDGFKITRSLPREGRKQVTVIDSDGKIFKQSAADKKIKEYLDIDDESYFSIMHASQGEITALAEANNTKRRDILFSWMGNAINTWNDARQEILTGRKTSRKELVEIKASIKALQSIIEQSNNDSNLEELQNNLNELTKNISKTKSDIEHCMAWNKLDTLNKNISELNNSLEPVHDNTSTENDLLKIREQLSIARDKSNQFNGILKNGFHGNCPFLGSTCPAIDHVNSQRSRTKEQADNAATEIKLLVGKESEKVNESNKFKSITRNNDRINGQIQAVRKDIGEINKKYPTAPVHDLDFYNNELKKLSYKKEHLINLRAEIQSHKETQSKLMKLQEKQKKLEIDYAAHDVIIKSIDSVAGPAVIAKANIENIANNLLENTGLSIELSWIRQTNELASECEECGAILTGKITHCDHCGAERTKVYKPDLVILVDDGKTKKDLKYKSGAAKQLVSLALRISAAIKSSKGWMILDEVDGALTDENCEILAKMLWKAYNLGIQLLVVTHRQTTAQHFSKVITIRSENSASYLY